MLPSQAGITLFAPPPCLLLGFRGEKNGSKLPALISAEALSRRYFEQKTVKERVLVSKGRLLYSQERSHHASYLTDREGGMPGADRKRMGVSFSTQRISGSLFPGKQNFRFPALTQ